MKARYELVDPAINANKFWEIEVSGSEYVTRYGRIGSKGSETVSRFSSPEEAQAEAEKARTSKEKKGYALVGGGGAAAKPRRAVEGKGESFKVAGFAVQLLHEWDGETVPADAVVEPKLDGLRCMFVFARGRYCCLSRDGNTLHNVGHIAAELGSIFDGWCLDGELFGGDWSKTMTDVRSGETGRGSGTFFVVFDCLTHEEVDSRTCRRTLRERRETLLFMFPRKPVTSGVIDQFPVKTPADVERMTDRFIKAGFEGAVLKDLDSFYSFKRGRDWTKVKRFKSGDYPIVGFEEGRGKHKGRLGKLLVKGPNGVVSGVGTGLTDEQREDFWRRREKLKGKVVEVKYQEVASSGGLRFPSFLRLRPDKG